MAGASMRICRDNVPWSIGLAWRLYPYRDVSRPKSASKRSKDFADTL